MLDGRGGGGAGAEDDAGGGFSDSGGSSGPGRMGRAPAGAGGGDLDDDIPF
jgi:hypothetical protein